MLTKFRIFWSLVVASLFLGTPADALVKNREIQVCPRSISLPPELSATDKSFIILGETHGTDTAPELFGDLVCFFVLDRPVVVHLEMPESLQPALEKYVEGDRAALNDILNHPMFTSRYYDGRASVAFIHLLDRLRNLRWQGYEISINAARPETKLPAGRHYFELAMALDWVQASAQVEGGLNLVLVGSAHAAVPRTTEDSPSYASAAMFLRRNDVFSLRACQQGGHAYVMNLEGETERRELSATHAALGRGILSLRGDKNAIDQRIAARFDYLACAGRPSKGSFRAAPALGKAGE